MTKRDDDAVDAEQDDEFGIDENERDSAIVSYRRTAIGMMFLFAFAWIIFAVLFDLNSLDQFVSAHHNATLFVDPQRVSLPLFNTLSAFTIIMWTLYALSVGFYFAGMRKLVLPVGARYPGAITIFVGVCAYMLLSIMWQGWRVVSLNDGLIAAVQPPSTLDVALVFRRLQNFYIYTSATSWFGVLTCMLIISVLSGILVNNVVMYDAEIAASFERDSSGDAAPVLKIVGTQPSQSRAHTGQTLTRDATSMRAKPSFRQTLGSRTRQSALPRSMADGEGSVAYYAPSGAFSTPDTAVKSQPSNVAAKHPPFTYIVVRHPRLRAFNFLSITATLTATFLFLMGFLALCQAQGIATISNAWVFAILYGVIGGCLNALHIYALLSYTSKNSDVTHNHMLYMNVHAVTCLLVWGITLFVFTVWLSKHSTGPCCLAANALAIVGAEPSWTIYNNILSISAAIATPSLVSLIWALSSHLNPERRFDPSIASITGHAPSTPGAYHNK